VKIRVSYGTGIVLGLIKARQDVAPTTAYLLFDRGCIGQCSFCSRANGNQESERLSRVIWPEFEMDEVVRLLSSEPVPFKRVCLQTGYNPDTEGLIKDMVKKLLATRLTISMTLSPSQCDFCLKMLELGVDHVGFGLDAATPEGYALHKKKDWATDWPNLVRIMRRMPQRIEVHLIFGLGESEEAFMFRIQEIVDNGGQVSLFAFTPVNGGEPPSRGPYRRVQIFRYLCERGIIRFESCKFEQGKLASLEMPNERLLELLATGDCFRTSGCGDCNRPYYNERPGETPYNYPRPLQHEEAMAGIYEAFAIK
jgi:biotin synthase-related radical SAM superfamily protein